MLVLRLHSIRFVVSAAVLHWCCCTHDGAPPDVILHIGPHLQLEVIEPVRHELLAGNALSDWQGLDLGPT